MMTTFRFTRWLSCFPVLAGLCLIAGLGGCRQEQQSSAAPVLGMRISSVLGDIEEAGFNKAQRPRRFVFPEDHGPHPGYRSEWWYLTAVLKTTQGREFGVQYTLFRQALTPAPTGTGPWHTGQAFMAHVAVTDVDNNRHLHDQRFVRGHPQLAGVSLDNGFRAWLEDWVLEGLTVNARQFDLHLQASADRFDLDLTLRQQQPIVLQGDAGLSHKGVGSASYYYSMPRLSISGVLEIEGQQHEVTGLGWLDREWSTSVLPAGVAGWDWFALQFSDGSSLMVFRLRRQDGLRDEYDHGVKVPAYDVSADSTTHTGTVLKAADYELTPLRYWVDDAGISWPVSWQLDLQGEQFFIDALVDDQLMDTGIMYWEGIVGVRDAQGASLGRGYMELTGYDTHPVTAAQNR
ncbi:MAG: lipocalin-like domain-containing protein [bacterium]